MYRLLYIFRVPKQHVQQFLRINQEAAAIYRCHGALESEVMRAADIGPKYGCLGIGDTMQASDNQVVFIGIDGFRDQAHCREVMPKVDADSRINELFAQIQQVVDLSTVVRGEFESVE